MWTAKRITADAADKMQIHSGLLLKTFDVTDPVAPQDADIICETTGNFRISCKPETKDWFEDVNNAPKNSMEGKDITGWDCALSVTALSITADTIKLTLGACEETSDKLGSRPKKKFSTTDFKSLYWVGDMMNETSALVVVMDNSVSVGGFDFTSSDNGKGELALEFMPHVSITAPDVMPMAFYVLTKKEA